MMSSFSILLKLNKCSLNPNSKLAKSFFHQRQLCSAWYQHRNSSKWPSHEVRQTFLDYFKSKDHIYVPSSSVVPKKGDGTYFVNAGMNQFKPLFLGTVDSSYEMANYKRVANSQKCIRVGGKHNDLEDVGKDSYHHTFFEMLGNWSFGDYGKMQACQMAWELLTNVFKIPASSLYITYFGGDEGLNLPPDFETQQIWLDLGISPDRIIPSGVKDNFWTMGDTGPCGPCSEIHYDYLQRSNASDLVNKSSPEVIELWNLVFINYDLLSDGTLVKLPFHSIDTGMGLERLTAVLQNRMSNYDTDLFQGIFDGICKMAKCPPYSGKFQTNDSELDESYRVIADHLRMITVAIADGVRPGKTGLDHKLRQILSRVIRYGHKLNLSPEWLPSLVPEVDKCLNSFYPDITEKVAQIQYIMEEALGQYYISLSQCDKMLQKMWNKNDVSKFISAEQIIDLTEGVYGNKVSFDVIEDFAEHHKITLDKERYNAMLQKVENARVSSSKVVELASLPSQDIAHLKSRDISPTDDSFKYKLKDLSKPFSAKVVAIKADQLYEDSSDTRGDISIILDKSCFYSEGGGQISDIGTLIGKEFLFKVNDVQLICGYVNHFGEVIEGNLCVGDNVLLSVNEARREEITSNHTATHIINYALNEILGDVHQMSSKVTADYFTFGFTAAKSTIEPDDLESISELCTNIIKEKLIVYQEELPLHDALKYKMMRYLKNEIYPNHVRVISIGNSIENLISNPQQIKNNLSSAEFCGGTHVRNTKYLGNLVITNLTGISQGTKKITGITGTAALEALSNGEELMELREELVNLIEADTQHNKWSELVSSIDKILGDKPLPKICRDETQKILNSLYKNTSLARQVKVTEKKLYSMRLHQVMADHSQYPFIVCEFPFEYARDIIAVLSTSNLDKPVMLISPAKEQDKFSIAVCYMPNKHPNGLLADAWAMHIAKHFNGNMRLPKGKMLKRAPNVRIISFKVRNTLTEVVNASKLFASTYVR